MSEKKEFKSLDVGASARIPWKIAKGLRENVGFKDDGSVEIAKNLEIDGNVLTLNGKRWGIMPVKVIRDNEKIEDIGFIFGDIDYYIGEQGDIGLDAFIFFDTYDYEFRYTNGIEILQPESETKIENGILFLTENDYGKFSDSLYYPMSLEEGQRKIYLHSLTLTANAKTYNITLQSTNNLKVDSIADLRTILNINATTDSLITPVCASDLTSTACLQITTALCKIGADNVTAVSDKVTAL